jgi:hypothetical protein
MMDLSNASCSSAAFMLMLPALAGVAGFVLERSRDLDALLVALGEGERQGGDRPSGISSCGCTFKSPGTPPAAPICSSVAAAAAKRGLGFSRVREGLPFDRVPTDALALLVDRKLNRGCCQSEQGSPSSSPSSCNTCHMQTLYTSRDDDLKTNFGCKCRLTLV